MIQVDWALLLDLEWHYNMDRTGIPTEHTQSVFHLECEWRCETESTIFAYWEFWRTFAGLDACISEAQYFPSSIPKKKNWNCLPAKHRNQGGRGEWERCSNFTKRRKSREANILALINRIPIWRFCLHWSIWFQIAICLAGLYSYRSPSGSQYPPPFLTDAEPCKGAGTLVVGVYASAAEGCREWCKIPAV